MHTTALSGEEVAARLEQSISGLAETRPELSARTLLSSRQKKVFIGVAAVLAIGELLDPINASIVVLSVIIVLYAAVVVDRVLLYLWSRRKDTMYVVSDEDARAVPDDQLPVYTVLIPAYREPEVIGEVLAHVDALEYPRDRLDVKLLLEADDDETIAAVVEANPGDHFEMVLVPPSEPRTKPKALNYALSVSRGELVTIYDAEDEPEPLQLRRAAVAMGRAPADIACIQAKLSFSNVEQNLITKWFTLEYSMWFALLLPGLVSIKAPLPLGGTSNHFRRNVLDELGAWDPHNVTEDADLGLRLARYGYRCGVLDSVTLEEANSDFINWIKQRSRWYKGYFQTALIHLRQPRTLYRQVGTVGTIQLILFILGTPLLAMLNPFFWALTAIYFIGHPHIIKELFPAPLFYLGTSCWIFGDFVILYLTVLTCRVMGRFELLWAAVLVPLYWIMMAIAATKAAWQLVVTPTYWEKTAHGLGHKDEAAVPISQ